jgi:hypothetical protein
MKFEPRSYRNVSGVDAKTQKPYSFNLVSGILTDDSGNDSLGDFRVPDDMDITKIKMKQVYTAVIAGESYKGRLGFRLTKLTAV